MNRDGSCCIARYGGGMYGVSKVDRIMMKYRPIAPKPVVTSGSGSGSGGSSTENSVGYVKCGRTKRKYVRVKKTNKNNTSKRKVTPPPSGSAKIAEPEVVTLSLLPQTPTQDRVHKNVFSVPDLSVEATTDIASKRKPIWLSFNNQEQQKVCYGRVIDMNEAVTKRLRVQPQVVSYVTVECVTDTWLDTQLLGYTDDEKLRNMEVDTCPGFITDDQDRVIWTNLAYRKMAGEELAVVLVRKDLSTFSLTVPAFTCKVRVASGASSNGLTVPCDVWRMERGGYAWRLDVKAALSLGR